MSVKGIRLDINTKRKIHDNVGHKEHSARYPQPHSVFVTSKNFNPPHQSPPHFPIDPHARWQM